MDILPSTRNQTENLSPCVPSNIEVQRRRLTRLFNVAFSYGFIKQISMSFAIPQSAPVSSTNSGTSPLSPPLRRGGGRNRKIPAKTGRSRNALSNLTPLLLRRGGRGEVPTTNQRPGGERRDAGLSFTSRRGNRRPCHDWFSMVLRAVRKIQID